jgi:hypothetical protein
MDITPQEAEELERPLRNVVERAVENGAPETPWIVTDSAEDTWFAAAASRSSFERARGVCAATREESLLRAHRLGFGGAAWLPASTQGMECALRAAAVMRVPDMGCCELSALEMCGGQSGALWAISFSHRTFWIEHHGPRTLSEALVELARRLGVAPLVVLWPALLVELNEAGVIRETWAELVSERPNLPSHGLLVTKLPPSPYGILARVTDALRAAEIEEPSMASLGSPSRPVCALPTGELVARWSPGRPLETSSSVATASPEIDRGGGWRWRIASTSDEEIVVPEAELPSRLSGDQQGIVKLPGRLTQELRPGSPAALLVQAFADASRRTGFTLWISNVDTVALKFLLRLGVPLWVDGPAVPENSEL